MSARGREITRYLASVERSLRGGMSDPIEVKPFVDYVNGRIARIEESWRRRGLDVHVTARSGESALYEALSDFGWADKNGAGYRRWSEISRRQVICSRRIIEDALEHAGVFIWDIYPGEEPDVELLADEPCPACRLDVTPLPLRGGRICPWCDTWLSRPETAQPRCEVIVARTGERCARRATSGERACWAHDLRNAERQRAALDAMRNNHLLPVEPLAAWLHDLVAAHEGSYLAVARQTATSKATVRAICVGAQRAVTPRVARRMLNAYRRRNPDADVPTLEQLWADSAAEPERAAA